MKVREFDSTGGQLVDVWRLYFRGSVATDIRVAKVVGQHEDDVGLVGIGCGSLGQQRRADREVDQVKNGSELVHEFFM